MIDLAQETRRQVIVDREGGQYLGHPTTCLLEDGRTMLCVYPKGHGRGAIVYKRSPDGGLTWSERLPTPASWATSKEVPTLHRVVGPDGRKRIILWSGLYPARLAVTEDDGLTWSELRPVGDWGGIVVMGCVEALKTGRGHYLAMFHDDGRYFKGGDKFTYGGVPTGERKNPLEMTLYKTFSRDGGLNWSEPEAILARSDVHLCEPGVIRSPDGRQLAALLRENSRRKNSHVIFSDDEGRTWSEPRELPAALTGDRHTGSYGPDGRLFISFRDRSPTTWTSPTAGDWVAWVGTYDDIVKDREGQYRVRLMDNHKDADCAYPGVEVLPDGTFVTTTYGHWTEGEQPYVVSVRLKLSELDAKVRDAAASPEETRVFVSSEEGYNAFRIPSAILSPAGHLLALAEGRKRGRGDSGDIDLVLRRSTDGGRTWGPLQIVWDDGPNTCGNPCPVVDHDTGTIWLLTTWNRGEDVESRIIAQTSSDTRRVFVTRSTDNGATWETPREITAAVKLANWTWYATGPGAGIQITQGPHQGRLVIPCDHIEAASGHYYSHIIYSDDHGWNWKLGGRTPMHEVNECEVAELSGNRLLLNMRNYSRAKPERQQAISHDGGLTWSGQRHVPELIEPICQASLRRFTAPTGDQPGVVLFSNPASKKREKLTIRLSRDEGQSWPIARELQAGPAAYSSLTVLPDHTIGCLYERGVESPYEEIAFARFTLGWVEGRP